MPRRGAGQLSSGGQLSRALAPHDGHIQPNKAEAAKLAGTCKPPRRSSSNSIRPSTWPAYPSGTRTNPWLNRGTVFREALGVLRTATAPMRVTELAAAVLAGAGITDADRRQQLGIEAGSRTSTLETRVGKTVQRGGKVCRSAGGSFRLRFQPYPLRLFVPQF